MERYKILMDLMTKEIISIDRKIERRQVAIDLSTSTEELVKMKEEIVDLNNRKRICIEHRTKLGNIALSKQDEFEVFGNRKR